LIIEHFLPFYRKYQPTKTIRTQRSSTLCAQLKIQRTSSPHLCRYERPGFEPSAQDCNRVRATYGIRDDPAPRSAGFRNRHPPAIATTVASTNVPISRRRNPGGGARCGEKHRLAF
jgi:hypothetical protein